MNKKFIGALSALLLSATCLTATAATTNATSTELQSLENSLKSTRTAQQELLDKVRQSDEYQKLEQQSADEQKAIIDQKLKEGSISANDAKTMKAQIDARLKLENDSEYQSLMKESQSLRDQLQTLSQKYTTSSTLLASSEFKDLKAKVVTNAKAIIDRQVADGAMTSDEAATAKSNIDTISKNIDAGTANINQLFRIGAGRGHHGFGGRDGIGGKDGFGGGRGHGGHGDFDGFHGQATNTGGTSTDSNSDGASL